MLFELPRHDPDIDQPCDEGQVRAAIARRVADTHTAFAGERWWPIHALEVSPEWPADSTGRCSTAPQG